MSYYKKYVKFAVKNVFKWCVGITTVLTVYNYMSSSAVPASTMIDGIIIQSILAPFFMFTFLPISISEMMKNDFRTGVIWESRNFLPPLIIRAFSKNRYIYVVSGILFTLLFLALPSILAVNAIVDSPITGFQYIIFKILHATMYALIIPTVVSLHAITDHQLLKEMSVSH